jgi:hypothetical protein
VTILSFFHFKRGLCCDIFCCRTHSRSLCQIYYFLFKKSYFSHTFNRGSHRGRKPQEKHVVSPFVGRSSGLSKIINLLVSNSEKRKEKKKSLLSIWRSLAKTSFQRGRKIEEACLALFGVSVLSKILVPTYAYPTSCLCFGYTLFFCFKTYIFLSMTFTNNALLV